MGGLDESAWAPNVLRPYRTKTSLELVNSLAVFQMCAIPFLVSATPTILEAAHRARMSGVLNSVIKATFFKHFCGGEDLKEVLPTMRAFANVGIGSILDLAMEADLDAAELRGADAAAAAAKTVKLFKQSLDIAANESDSFIAVKVTALLPPTVLQRWSNSLLRLRAAADSVAGTAPGSSAAISLSSAEFAKVARASELPLLAAQSDSQLAELFGRADSDADGRVDWPDLVALFSLHAKDSLAHLLASPAAQSASETTANAASNAAFAIASAEDINTAKLVLAEVDDLCAYALSKRVKIMMDAEQTYFQPAIDDIVIALCRRWNPRPGAKVDPANSASNGLPGPLIFNTYQMYLRDSYARLTADYLASQRFGYSFGVKIVRGAYMVSERERATELGLADPIQPSLEASHASYNSAITFLIEQLAKHPRSTDVVKPLSFVVASHNKDSVRLATRLMAQNGISPRDGSVGFAQLMGMQDGTSFALASNGFRSFKYIPYGPVEVTVPYLHRRAQENSSVLGAVGEDRRNLFTELKIRMGLVRAE
eukprot:jgi/Hompol1/5680/HPOL_004627-RA